VSSSGNPEPHKQETAKPPKRNWQATEPFCDLKLSHWVGILLTAALVVVGISQFVVYLRQASIMREQASISARQIEDARVTNRAFMSYKTTSLAPVYDVADGPVTGWFIQITLENLGNTPTHDYRVSRQLEWVPRNEGAMWRPINPSPDSLRHATPLGPKGEDGLQEIMLPVDRIIAALNGGSLPVVCLWAFYHDIYNGTPQHHLRMCFQVKITDDPHNPHAGFILSRFGDFDEAD